MPDAEFYCLLLLSYGVLNAAVYAYRIGFKFDRVFPVNFVEKVIDSRFYAEREGAVNGY